MFKWSVDIKNQIDIKNREKQINHGLSRMHKKKVG